MRCFLPTGSIDKIDLYAAGIEMYLLIIIFYLSHFNAPKSVLCVKNLAAS